MVVLTLTLISHHCMHATSTAYGGSIDNNDGSIDNNDGTVVLTITMVVTSIDYNDGSIDNDDGSIE